MNKDLLKEEVQEFISFNFNSDLSKLIFRGSPFKGISVQDLAIQLKGKKTARKKFPVLFEKEGILYPQSVSLEQSSSEMTSKYKASLVKGDSFIDLTGGLGIDSIFFSKKFLRCLYCETNEELTAIAAHNFKLLKIDNIEVFPGDGISYLRGSQENFSCIYLDPSRRARTGEKVFRLSDCIPSAGDHLDLFFKKAGKVILKTSPLLDLHAGVSQLEWVKEIHVVAVENDVKELIWILEKGVCGDIKIYTVNFGRSNTQEYDNFFGSIPGVKTGTPKKYLYEPNAAIMKGALYDELAMDLNLEKLHPNSHLFTSDDNKDFPGRSFVILRVLPYKAKILKKCLGIEKAHVTTRNFPETVKELRKKFKLRDGGSDYLFFTTSGDNEKIVIICRKTSPNP